MRNDDYEFFLNQVHGLIIIDIEGKVVFMSKQCGDYIKVDAVNSIGKSIDKVFPPTKMLDALKNNLPETVDFYFVDGKVSGSTRFPLKENGKTVGIMEYDLFQEYGAMEEFVETYVHMDEELRYFREEVRKFRNSKYSIDNIIGNSDKVTALKKQIRYASQSKSTVIISGETGTGKELVAHSIHSLSRRSLRNFVKINGAALPEGLAESELFGYEGGTFTGAQKEGKKGKFELADKGTIFIDEINQLPYALQPKLLRVLQEKEIDRIGCEESVPIDVRVIAATNEDLMKLVKEGNFREDLYYRLNVIVIETPALRERIEDIPLLVQTFVRQFNTIFGKDVAEIDKKVYDVLMKQEWPGNVRELQNVIERAMNYVNGRYLSLEHFDLPYSPVEISTEIANLSDNPIEEIKKEAERNLILRSLEKFDGNKSKTAEFLKISRPLLYQKIGRLGIKFNSI